MRSSNITLLAIAGVATATILAACSSGVDSRTGAGAPATAPVATKNVSPENCPKWIGKYESTNQENVPEAAQKTMIISLAYQPGIPTAPFRYKFEFETQEVDLSPIKKTRGSNKKAKEPVVQTSKEEIIVGAGRVDKTSTYLDGNQSGYFYEAQCSANSLDVQYFSVEGKLTKARSVVGSKDGSALKITETVYKDGKPSNPVEEIWKKLESPALF